MPAQNRPAKKTAASRTSDKPAPVGFNFDTYHRDEPIEPFPIVIGGKRYESLDPMDLDYRDIVKAFNASDDMYEALFQTLFAEDDAAEILEHKLPLGAVTKFGKALEVHFGLEDFAAALG